MKRKQENNDSPVVTPEFEATSQRIQELLDEAERGATQAHYEVGEQTQRILNNPQAFGLKSDRGAVKALAARTGRNKHIIYNAARVAKAWPRDEFMARLKKQGPDGFRLTYEHFVESTRVDDVEAREALMDKARSEKLSTRQLRELRAAKQKRTVRRQPVLSRLSKVTAAVERAVQLLKDLHLEPDAIDDESRGEVYRRLDLLAGEEHVLKELCAVKLKEHHQLAAALQAATRSPVDPPVRLVPQESPYGAASA